MRALVCREFGPPELLEIGELPEPRPGPGEVGIAVHAAGLSYADTLMIRNQHQNKHELPFAPGMEVAGTVTALGEGVSGFAVGDRVMALVYDGGFAERAVARATETFRLPDGMDFATAAAMASVYLTAHVALRWEARLEPGETLLVLGAAGGTGLAAVQIGKALGATVIAAASTAAKLAVAAQSGADHGIDYTAEDLRRRALDLTGGDGVNVVFDPVAGDLHEPAFRALDWGGRYLVIGFAGGAIPRIPANHLLVKNRAALGIGLMHYRRHRTDRLARSAAELFDLFLSGRIGPLISERIALGDAPEALRRIADRRTVGKLVIEMRPEGAPR